MQLIQSIVRWYMTRRIVQIERFKKQPFQMQNDTLLSLVNTAQNTQYGKQYYFKNIASPIHYKQQVPVIDYEDLKPFIDKIIAGEQQVLWSSTIKWMAKSSGTSNDKSKLIPVSKETLNNCHYRAARDVLGTYAHLHPNSQLFEGKGIILGGSHQIHTLNKHISVGDLSAVLVQNMSHLGRYLSSVNLEISLMNEWEQKLNKLAQYYISQRVSNLLGVPSWMLVFLKKVLEITGKNTISEVWQDLELYIHGGVSFMPYKAHFEQVIGGRCIHYQQTYNASEGFFAMQDTIEGKDMLLMLDLGIYFEFMPLSELSAAKPRTLNLQEVELGVHYALIISTQSGLWRYMVGDTVQFTSLKPHRIIVSGRTKQFINVFGEELMVDNTDKAIAAACASTGAVVLDYTVAPIFMDQNSAAGGHQWAIEFEHLPVSLSEFTQVLDQNLQQINSDYEAKRYLDKVLKMPLVEQVIKGSFHNWLLNKGKLGGQHKVPRLSNERIMLEQILRIHENLKA